MEWSYQAYQRPATFVLHHQGTPRVALAGVLNVAILTHRTQMRESRNLAAVEVASADHLVVDDHVDSLLAVPLLTLPVVDHWHVDHLRARIIRNYQRFYNIQALQSHPDQKDVGMKTDDEKDFDNDDVDVAHNMCVVCVVPQFPDLRLSFLGNECCATTITEPMLTR